MDRSVESWRERPTARQPTALRRSAWRSDQVIARCLLAYAALAGLQIPIGASSRLAPGDVLLLLAAGLAAAWGRLQRPAAALPWLALPLLLSYGLLVSLVADRAITQYLLVSKLAGGFSLAVAGFLFQGFVGRLGTRRVCLHAFWGAVAVNSAGYVEFRLGVLRDHGFVYDESQIGRFSGLAVDSNANAALLATAALCGVHLLLDLPGHRRLQRAATVAGTAWCTYLFLISYSRGGFVAAAGGGVVYYGYRVRAGRAAPPRPWQLLAGLAAATGAWLRPPVDLLLGGRTDLRSVDSRLDLLDNALQMLNENDVHWLTGVGLGAFHAVHRQVIHSTPAWLYVEMGLPGALFLLALSALITLWVRRADRLGCRHVELWIGVLTVYGLMGLSIEALYQRPLWIALGCLAGLRGWSRDIHDPAEPGQELPSMAVTRSRHCFSVLKLAAA